MQGLSVSHQFFFFEDEDGVLWLLNRSAEDGCKCCIRRNEIIHRRGEINSTNAKIDPVEVVIYRPSPSSSQQNRNPAELSIEGLSSHHQQPQQQPSFTGFRKKTSKIHAKNLSNNTVITQQPLPLSDEQKNAMSKQTSKKDEKTPNCCRLCCIECGTCCVGLLNNS